MKQLTQEMLLSKKLYFPLKSCRPDWCIDFIERIHSKLEDRKELLNAERKIDQMLPDAKII